MPQVTTSGFKGGRTSSIGTTAVQLLATLGSAANGVLIKSANANTALIYVGSSAVTADSADGTSGFELAAGEAITLEIDDPSKLYVIAASGTQKVYWMAV